MGQPQWRPVTQQQQPHYQPDIKAVIEPVLSTREDAAASAARPALFTLLIGVAGFFIALFAGLVANDRRVFLDALKIDVLAIGVVLVFLANHEFGQHADERSARIALLRKVEEWIDRDLTGDGIIGEPPEHEPILLNGGARKVAPGPDVEFWRFVNDAHTWGTPEASPIARGEQTLKTKYSANYEIYRDLLIDSGVAEWKDERNHLLGWTMHHPREIVGIVHMADDDEA